MRITSHLIMWDSESDDLPGGGGGGGGGIKQSYQSRNSGPNRIEEQSNRVRPRLHQRESEGAARRPGSQLPPLQCQETTMICVQYEFTTSFPLRMYWVWQDPGFLAAQVSPPTHSKCWSHLPFIVFHLHLQDLSGQSDTFRSLLSVWGQLVCWPAGWLAEMGLWRYAALTTQVQPPFGNEGSLVEQVDWSLETYSRFY